MALSNETRKDLKSLEMDVMHVRRTVQEGSIWRHTRTGGRYEVGGICIIEKTQVVAIAYRATSGSPIVWVRPANEFLSRFVLIED